MCRWWPPPLANCLRRKPINRSPNARSPNQLSRPRLHRDGSSCPRQAHGRSIKPRSSHPWPQLPHHPALRPAREPAFNADGRFLIAGPRALRVARAAVFNAHRAARRARDNSLAVRGPSIRRVPILAALPPARPAHRLAVPASVRGLALERGPVLVRPVQAASPPAVRHPRPPQKLRAHNAPARPEAAAGANNTPRPKKAR